VLVTGGITADLRGRVAVVTGASSGLGARFAEVLAVSGAVVFAAARRRERLDALAVRVPGVIPVTCDVTRAEDRELLHQAALGETGRVDVLVNNAGYGRGVSALEESVAEFEEIIALNRPQHADAAPGPPGRA
jgi:NADP-dependent 3-hydroxy acid dehydrogenase YdfG